MTPEPHPLKIYIAGSWRNAWNLIPLQETLEDFGFRVDLFCSEKTGRFVFSWDCLGAALGCLNQAESEFKLKDMDAKDLLQFPEVQKAFLEDKKWIDWCDVLILTLPSGKSAHLEAGYAKGQGKKLFIYGRLEKGERDVMYGFADGIFHDDYDFPNLIEALKGCASHSSVGASAELVLEEQITELSEFVHENAEMVQNKLEDKWGDFDLMITSIWKELQKRGREPG